MLTRAVFCDLVEWDSYDLKNLNRRRQTPIETENRAHRNQYSVFEAFLCVLVEELFSQPPHMTRDGAVTVVNPLRPWLQREGPRIESTSRLLVEKPVGRLGEPYRIDEIFGEVIWMSAFDHRGSHHAFAGTLEEIAAARVANAKEYNLAQPNRGVLVNASRAMALLRQRAKRLGHDLGIDEDEA